RTLREARAVAQLSHPHIIVVHDVVEDGERPCIVMELIDGGRTPTSSAPGAPVSGPATTSAGASSGSRSPSGSATGSRSAGPTAAVPGGSASPASDGRPGTPTAPSCYRVARDPAGFALAVPE
ncbi:hypothetical protein ACFV06_41330, partial [Streptomyces sp. NPDC059618]